MEKIQAPIPDQVQETASAVIKSMGLTVSDAVRMFMTRIARDRTLPLGSISTKSGNITSYRECRNGTRRTYIFRQLKDHDTRR